jgi:hypothetical protein
MDVTTWSDDRHAGRRLGHRALQLEIGRPLLQPPWEMLAVRTLSLL